MSTTSYNCTNDAQRAEGLAHAQKAIAAKQVIVMPTDTVYGIAADAFSPQAVATLLAAKGRGRNMPPPVLIPRIGTMEGLAVDIPDDARKLAEKYWPGPLTLIFHAQPTLTWDLGETHGTVALRVPDDQLALDLLTITGPLAVSSANRTGQEAAQTASEARTQLAESVEVYLESGFRPLEGTDPTPSTIVDATGLRLRVVREGAISLEEIKRMIPSVLGADVEPDVWEPANLSKEPLSEENAQGAPVLNLEKPAEAQDAVPAENADPVEEAEASKDAAGS
ncbi:tRNA threonylcarbamoyl adenosine modification protein, Sua5/YciO/YrdC/YwlC family [Arthrobacter alpinus]|uniref:L-threonylcarbamoyladenylate synthase n=1 Tax=Arthrobacter alpinus TaxID=656366 RepID=A0A1H5EPB3_9MICC|nr:L-threonylcarbamoyladenylate synthase [Arthrobacter alpinus]SED93013.1 tRNA threonylcarbamoyl adenosine modification protein, Sua5/YciO/YrdC/YwlC family [Arthrobacter alpinus]